MDALLNIKAVARRTGLSAHVIRIWEKRYQAVVPTRTATNRRLYAESEIERLGLLARAIRAGHTISQIAGLPVGTLRGLAATDTNAVAGAGAGEPRPRATTARDFVREALEAVRDLDGLELERVMKAAELALGQMGLLCKVLSPLLEQLGKSWRAGDLLAAHEHLASQAVRSFLGNLSRPYAATDQAPELVVTTPVGQLHELGALMAAATAHHEGWRVTYLGPCLPADEIAGAVRQKHARAVALSVVHPADDPTLPRELEKLRQSLPAGTAMLVGGRAAGAYAETLKGIDAITCETLVDLQNALDAVRQGRGGAFRGATRA